MKAFGMPKQIGPLLFLLLTWLTDPGTAGAVPPPPSAPVGINKFDLFTQYTGTASGCNGTEACRRVTRAMARKALDDAKDAGVNFVRVSMSGRTAEGGDDNDADVPKSGTDSLALWRTDPTRFWQQVDVMMDDLDARGMHIVPVLMWGGQKFPLMAGETIGDLLNDPNSRSWGLLSSFVTDFVTRYRKRPTVLFYELTNEFNNSVDLDHERRCAKSRKRFCGVMVNFTTDEMVAFTKRFAALIRSLDDTRLISSGFTIPRGSAGHLRARPEWSIGGPDWSPDNREQFAKNLKDIHAGVDIISIHLYGGDRNERFGSGDVVDLLAEAKRVADEVGKPLFVGEFGEVDPMSAGPGTHTARMIDKIVELRVPYSAVWVWEFYQNKPYATHDTKPSKLSLEPGYTDYLIGRIRQANTGSSGAKLQTKDSRPPRVVLTWPLDCSELSSGQSIHAVASDDSGVVDRVEFWLDDLKLGDDATIPYSHGFAAQNVSAGEHRLSARAFDASGNRSEFVTKVLFASGSKQRKDCLVAVRAGQ